MHKLPIGEAAEVLGISKEAIYNRIRRGSLRSVEKDGVKFVIIDDEANEQKSDKKPSKKAPKSIEKTDSEFVKFLLAELAELKGKNENLLADKERLFKEKEQMLIDSKNEISQIYKERDEKLMAFLNAMQNPLLNRANQAHNSDSDEIVEAHVEDDEEQKFVVVSEYLRALNLSYKEYKKAQKKIIKQIGKSKFVKFQNGVILIKKDKKLKHIIGDL
ncbi:DNA-binding protein [Campylobacter mucosalis]|uniref:Uncharacterized protein n=1 Tax=Campylobacter mucosalis CCUG 21559 TaxID=1032067 RepID=A0A6G5QE86_9BACT|nr:DNA-binding protein [Campylobacter mucosalis]QCD43962.1 hypothetical protein CMUC_0142 [Campylobacter mucosalis CCUG 21559]